MDTFTVFFQKAEIKQKNKFKPVVKFYHISTFVVSYLQSTILTWAGADRQAGWPEVDPTKLGGGGSLAVNRKSELSAVA